MWVVLSLALAPLATAGCAEIGAPDNGDPGAADAGGGGGQPDAEVDTCPEGWLDCGFAYRRQLTFDNSAQPEELVDFPVLVQLDPVRFDYARAQQDGADLRFTDGAGQLLPHEIERWNPSGVSIVWVRVASIGASSATDAVFMYYGNPSPGAAPSPAEVWSNGYRGVWHLAENPNSSAPQRDSTSHDNHGSVIGMNQSNRVEGRFGHALNFTGETDWVQVPDSASLQVTGTALTVSAWIRRSGDPMGDAGIVVKSYPRGTQNIEHNYHLGVVGGTKGQVRILIENDYPAKRLDGTSTFAAGAWHHVALVYDGTAMRFYVDGAQESSQAQTGVLEPADQPLFIGRRTVGDDGADRFFRGAIDEVRVAAVARSPAWLAAQYLSMTDAFVTYGPEQEP